MLHRIIGCTAIASAALWATAAAAVVDYNTNIPSDNIIHGEGNQNGGFTVVTENNIVVGLRATVRYDVLTNQPQAVYNDDDANGTFNHAAGAPPSNPDRARWNVTWSVDTTLANAGLATYNYLIGLDYDPGVGTSYRTFDPIEGVNPTYGFILWDHGIGSRTTGEGDGDDDFVSGDRDTQAEYLALLGNTVAQNSWNWAFFDGPGFPFDPNLDGEYSVFFEVFDGTNNNSLARADITVIVGKGASVPEPAALGLLGLGLVGLAAARRRKA